MSGLCDLCTPAGAPAVAPATKGKGRRPVCVINGGSIVGMHKPHQIVSLSMLHVKFTLFAHIDPQTGGLFSKASATQPAVQASNRVRLFNTKCIFFAKSCCNKGDKCPFLHDEEPLSTIFHDGGEVVRTRVCRPPPGPLVTAKIYVKNLPPDCTEDMLKNIASPFGHVKEALVLKSQLACGRRSAFVIMTSEAQAKAAIDELNTVVRDGERFIAKLQEVKPEVQRPEPAPPKPKVVTITDAEGFTSKTKLKVSSASVGEAAVALNKKKADKVAGKMAGFSLLADLDDDGDVASDDAPEEEIVSTGGTGSSEKLEGSVDRLLADGTPEAAAELSAILEDDSAPMPQLEDTEDMAEHPLGLSLAKDTDKGTPPSVIALNPMEKKAWTEQTRNDKVREGLIQMRLEEKAEWDAYEVSLKKGTRRMTERSPSAFELQELEEATEEHAEEAEEDDEEDDEAFDDHHWMFEKRIRIEVLGKPVDKLAEEPVDAAEALAEEPAAWVELNQPDSWEKYA